MAEKKYDPNKTFAQKTLEILGKKAALMPAAEYERMRGQLQEYAKIIEKDVGKLSPEYESFAKTATPQEIRTLQNTIFRNNKAITEMRRRGFSEDEILSEMLTRAGISKKR